MSLNNKILAIAGIFFLAAIANTSSPATSDAYALKSYEADLCTVVVVTCLRNNPSICTVDIQYEPC